MRTDRVHGFRRSFRDWAGDIGHFDREVIEHALAHQLPDKREASYRRGSAINKRALLMQAWANYCDGAQSLPTMCGGWERLELEEGRTSAFGRCRRP